MSPYLPVFIRKRIILVVISKIFNTFSSLSSNNNLSSSFSALAFCNCCSTVCSLITVVKENILDDKFFFPT